MLYQTGSFRTYIKNTSNKTIVMVPLLILQTSDQGLGICVGVTLKLNKFPYPNKTQKKKNPYKIIFQNQKQLVILF